MAIKNIKRRYTIASNEHMLHIWVERRSRRRVWLLIGNAIARQWTVIALARDSREADDLTTGWGHQAGGSRRNCRAIQAAAKFSTYYVICATQPAPDGFV
jgi:hypothetical protein